MPIGRPGFRQRQAMMALPGGLQVDRNMLMSLVQDQAFLPQGVFAGSWAGGLTNRNPHFNLSRLLRNPNSILRQRLPGALGFDPFAPPQQQFMQGGQQGGIPGLGIQIRPGGGRGFGGGLGGGVGSGFGGGGFNFGAAVPTGFGPGTGSERFRRWTTGRRARPSRGSSNMLVPPGFPF